MDFLWECALAPGGKDRAYLIPDGNDLATPHACDGFAPETIHCSSTSAGESEEPVRVAVVEEKGEGVVDIIGGIVWEAALLLCGIVMMNPEKFLACNAVLELGAGVGLPSLLLGHLRTGSSRFAGSAQLQHVILTDNDAVLLSNLKDSVRKQFETRETAQEAAAVDFSIAPLDWMLFSDPQSSPSPCSSSPHALEVGPGDIVFGSALCYAPVHANLLIGVIHHFLRLGCAEVVVLQISDREGFQHLLALLAASKELRSSCVPVPQEVFDYAQSIHRQVRTATGSTIVYEYCFPPFEPHLQSKSQGNSLIRTDRECFSLLSVKLNTSS